MCLTDLNDRPGADARRVKQHAKHHGGRHLYLLYIVCCAGDKRGGPEPGHLRV